MAEQQEINVKLTAGAALDFAEVLADAMEHLDPNIITKAQQASKAGDGGESAGELGSTIIKTLLKHSRASAFRFLATAAGMTEQELKDAPLSTLTTIVRKIKDDPELADFLEQARGMLD